MTELPYIKGKGLGLSFICLLEARFYSTRQGPLPLHQKSRLPAADVPDCSCTCTEHKSTIIKAPKLLLLSSALLSAQAAAPVCCTRQGSGQSKQWQGPMKTSCWPSLRQGTAASRPVHLETKSSSGGRTCGLRARSSRCAPGAQQQTGQCTWE